jgi:hypothetical protein
MCVCVGGGGGRWGDVRGVCGGAGAATRTNGPVEGGRGDGHLRQRGAAVGERRAKHVQGGDIQRPATQDRKHDELKGQQRRHLPQPANPAQLWAWAWAGAKRVVVVVVVP